MTIFGDIVDGAQVEDSVRECLRLWFPTYLRELEFQRGLPLGEIPPPRSYTVTEESMKEPEDQLPGLVVISPGVSDEPTMEGDGVYTATFAVEVEMFASATDRETTRLLVRRYAAVVRSLLAQQRPAVVTFTRWTGEAYDGREFDDTRTFNSAKVIFEMDVHAVVNRRAGPLTPPDPEEQPGSDWPVVDEAIVVVEPVEEVTIP